MPWPSILLWAQRLGRGAWEKGATSQPKCGARKQTVQDGCSTATPCGNDRHNSPVDGSTPETLLLGLRSLWTKETPNTLWKRGMRDILKKGQGDFLLRRACGGCAVNWRCRAFWVQKNKRMDIKQETMPSHGIPPKKQCFLWGLRG